MKEAFKAAEVEVIRFDREDIIRTSSCNYEVIHGCSTICTNKAAG